MDRFGNPRLSFKQARWCPPCPRKKEVLGSINMEVSIKPFVVSTPCGGGCVSTLCCGDCETMACIKKIVSWNHRSDPKKIIVQTSPLSYFLESKTSIPFLKLENEPEES